MDNDMKSRIIALLESSQERKRKIALLHYELDHISQTSGREIIEAMALVHSEGGGHTNGHISDKTFYIAIKEALNKSPHTSWRHLFRLTSLKNLEIHKVFPRFFVSSKQKI